MQRDLSVTIGIIGIILVVGIFVISANQNNSLQLSDSNEIPTSNLVLGATTTTTLPTAVPTVTVTPPLIKSPTVTATITPTITKTPTPTPTKTTSVIATPEKYTCTSKTHEARIKATEFMNTHKAKDPYAVLALISEPQSDADKGSLEFWLDTDGGTVPKLYSTTSTTYETVSFRFPQDAREKGDHPEERGAKKCILRVVETRRFETPDNPFEQSDMTRYLQFSLTVDGTLKLTGFLETEGGQKYTGFN